MTREFILNTLIGYKEDPSTCAGDKGNCLYLTKDGRKCAVGKHMREGPWQKVTFGIADIFEDYDSKEFLTKEAYDQNISIILWEVMQSYHDSIFRNDLDGANYYVIRLEHITTFKFPELKFNS